MPGGDGTGPMGLGPMTGRGAGFCAGYSAPGYANAWPRFGRGRVFGRGMGRGWRRFGFAPVQPIVPADRIVPIYPAQPAYQPTKEEEIQYLESDAKAIQAEQNVLNQELDAVKKRLEELKKKK